MQWKQVTKKEKSLLIFSQQPGLHTHSCLCKVPLIESLLWQDSNQSCSSVNDLDEKKDRTSFPRHRLARPDVRHCFSHCCSSRKTWSRAWASWGRSSLLAGYMLAQWAVPGSKRKFMLWRTWRGAKSGEKWSFTRTIIHPMKSESNKRVIVLPWKSGLVLVNVNKPQRTLTCNRF